MMEYGDKCVISRSTGNVDVNGNEVFTQLYAGECLLQIKGSVRYDGFQFEQEPLMFIPVNNVLFKTNDKVEVETYFGRKMKYTIGDWEAIKDDDFEELNDTCIWLLDGLENY